MGIKRIHVNQHRIRSNAKIGGIGERLPVLTIKETGSNVYGNEVEILDDNGSVVAKVIYSPDKPLSCGAKVWIECRGQIRVM